MFQILAAGILLMLSLNGCRETRIGSIDDSDRSLLISSGERNLDPDNTQAEWNRFVGDNNAFAFDLYHAIGDDAENLLFSPYSISVALAMTWGGAANRTESQMADTLHFSFPQEKMHSLFNELDLGLNDRNQNDPANEDKYLKLKIANAVWGQKDYGFLESYLDLLMFHYGAGIRLADFIHNPSRARFDINDWVAEQTENRIQDLLAQDDVNTSTRMVLTNAIYFKASWGIPFDPDQTYSGVFHCEDGTDVPVSMMIPAPGSGENGENYAAAEGPGYQAVQLPYYGDDFSMLIVIPDAGTFSAFEQDMNAAMMEQITGGLSKQDVNLKMPKFGYETRVQLSDTLSGMGMPDAFIPGSADFSGMDGGLSLFLDKVIHQASVTVDEAGTEAAAATAVVMTYSPDPDPIEITIDRPFIYMIRDNQTGAVLFLGRVKDPS